MRECESQRLVLMTASFAVTLNLIPKNTPKFSNLQNFSAHATLRFSVKNG